MTIKNILVAYNGGAASDAALLLARQMSQKYTAHLTGIMAHGISSATKHMPSWLSASFRKSIVETFESRGDEVKARFFDQIGSDLPEEYVHWLDVAADPDRSVATIARVFDVTVVGQYENLPEQDAMLLHPDRIAHEASGPVIIAPKTYTATALNERAVVAWDGSRTAARALMDAMHILETKDHVCVVTIGQHTFDRIPRTLDICTLLARHGIQAEQHILEAKQGNEAQVLLEICETSDFGLLVMGAYERKKFAEDLMGGFTDTVIQKLNLPAFVSH